MKESGSSSQKLTKSESLTGLRAVCSYFEKHSEENSLFIPELIAAKKIYSILESREELSETDKSEIRAIIDETEKSDHHDGTGWFDFKIRLQYFLK